MKKKIISLVYILIYFLGNYSSFACAAEGVFQGHAEKAETLKEQSELFTGNIDELNRKDVLIMNVSKVLDTNSSQKNDEFFA